MQDSSGIVRLRRADRAFHSWGVELCPFLTRSCRLPSFPDIGVSVQYATEHRCAVVLRGPHLSDCITGTDPLVDDRPLLQCAPTVASDHAEYSDAERTSRVVNELSGVVARLLSNHPLIVRRRSEGLPITNLVLLRGAGKRIQVPPFTWPPAFSVDQSNPSSHAQQSKDGVAAASGTAFVLAPTAIIGGLAVSLGMERIHCEGATGDYRTDLNKKAEAAARSIRASQHAFGMLHVKAVDDAGHDRSVSRKCEWIGKVDSMIGRLVELLSEPSHSTAQPVVLAVTADHSTPVLYGDHAHEPVPVLMAAVGGKEEGGDTERQRQSMLSELLRADSAVERFDEVSSSRGVLGRFPGSELLPTIERFCGLVHDHYR